MRGAALLMAGAALAGAPVSAPAAVPGQVIAVFGNSSLPYLTARVVITPGSMVIFRNYDTTMHNVESVTPGLFASPYLGLTQNYKIDTSLLPPGTYAFVCGHHPLMKGALIVKKL